MYRCYCLVGGKLRTPLGSGAWDSSTTLLNPYLIFPEAVRKAWTSALQAKSATLEAPKAFWASPFSAPFSALRATCKP